MAVQQEIKSQLAKLLATEDLVVEHRHVSTAQFDVHSRVLTLPLWEKASGTVYDMLVGHEVSHALFTPDEDWTLTTRVPQQFINVVEDVRVEKLMKRKYMGIAKTFYRGYDELHGNDFFELDGEDYNSFNLADRVNLYYKIGSFIDVSFSDAEKEIVDLIGRCETFSDTKKAALVLYEYCKKQQEQEEKISLDGQKKGNDDVELNSEGQTDEGKEGEEKSEVESPQTPQMQESGGDSCDDLPDLPEPEVRTADSLSERIKELVNEQGKENNYVEIPKVNLDTIIIKNSEVHEEIDSDWAVQQVVHDNLIKERGIIPSDRIPQNIFEKVDADFVQFKRDAQKEVNYLVKEFECRKAASSYARAATSRTGVLDTTKLHTYRYNEDIFKKITVLPDGKNHGLVFILDWSGSMQYVLSDTCKQLFNLIWFCRKVNIPFDVYAFTSEWNRRGYDSPRNLPDHYEKVEGVFAIEKEFSLMNVLTSKVNAKTLEKQMINIWRLAESFGRREGSFYRYVDKMCLSGTPLNEALVSLHQILPKFQKENKVEKVQCIILTDGEASYLPYHKEIDRSWLGHGEEPFMGCRNVRPGQTFLRDRKVGMTYGFKYDYHEFSEVLLTNLKDRFPTVNFVGIRVLPNREASRFIRLYYPSGNESLSNDWKKHKSFTIKNSGYDAYFAMSAQSLADDTEFDVKEDATKAQIKRAFVKSLKTKKLNKKVLGEFISLVA